jgi:hypothetical protein
MRTLVVSLLLIAGFSQVAAGATRSLQELRIRWDGYDAGPPANAFTLLQRRVFSGSLPRNRTPELAEGQILIVFVGGEGEELDSQLIPDPRVLRSEAPDSTGIITGEILQHPSPSELLIAFADDPTITELRIYQPRWTGSTFVLDLLGAVSLPSGGSGHAIP